MTDVVIVGGGHNGLIAAFYLARAGIRPLVLERRAVVGGGAITGELHPGFHCPMLAHDTGLMSRDLVRDMQLERHGADFLAPSTDVFAPGLDGQALLLYQDPRHSAESIRRLSARDADAYPAFRDALARIAAVLASLLSEAPPDIEDTRAAELWTLLRTGCRFRALGKRDAYRLLRWVPMPVADFVHEWFESELLCAALAARGVSGTKFGPRSAGSALVLLMHEAHRGRGVAGQVRGGPGALTRALASAAAAAGANIRTGAAVARIVCKDEQVSGVVLEDGSEIAAGVVISAADPKTTFLRLLDPLDLTPDFLTKARNYRSSGTLAKVNLALSALPRFEALDASDHAAALSGRIHIGPELDYLERAFDHAKYGEVSDEPWLDITIPSVLDPSLAPASAHVMSIYAHCAPRVLRHTTWDAARDTLYAGVLRTLARYAPDIEPLVLAAQVITPEQLEREYGFFGGHIFHGELAIDQLYTMRPILGFGSYRGPVKGLYLCCAGTHPGGFMTGLSGMHAARRVAVDLKR